MGQTDLYLVCCKCKKTFRINTTQEQLYTEEVKAKWTCLSCDGMKSKHVHSSVKEACKILAKDDKALTELANKFVEASKTKVCKKCQTEKSVLEFGKDKAMKDGLYYICKECAKPKPKEKV